MSQEKRRDEDCRREKVERRENGSSMISNYANYSGVERRVNPDRRSTPERSTPAKRAVVACSFSNLDLRPDPVRAHRKSDGSEIQDGRERSGKVRTRGTQFVGPVCECLLCPLESNLRTSIAKTDVDTAVSSYSHS